MDHVGLSHSIAIVPSPSLLVLRTEIILGPDKREFGSGTSFQYYVAALSRRKCRVELATDIMIPTSVMQQYDRIHPWCVSFSTNQQEDRGILCSMAGWRLIIPHCMQPFQGICVTLDSQEKHLPLISFALHHKQSSGFGWRRKNRQTRTRWSVPTGTAEKNGHWAMHGFTPQSLILYTTAPGNSCWWKGFSALPVFGEQKNER
jgi:hypothetical protein